MKFTRKVIALLFLALTGISAILIINPFEKSTGFTPPQLFPGDYLAQQRMYPYDEINLDVYKTEMKKAAELKQQKASLTYTWEFAGPTNIGGRITDIEIHPDEPETIYIGASTGGVWKSTDMGASWEYKFEGANLISVGDIAIDPEDKNTIYAGTAEANNASYSFIGDGIYKSTDAGETWQNIGLENSAYISRIVIDHSNSQRIWVAANGNLFTPDSERGIYRSEDGGMNWEKVLFVNDSTSATEIVQHPTNPDILYAGMWERMRGLTYRHSFGLGTGVYKSTDGGDTWTELTNGLPFNEDAGRVGLSIAKSNPDVIYAFYDMPDYEVNVFRTTDGGDSWTQTNDNALDEMNSNFGWYFGQVRVHPQDEDMVFVMGVGFFRTSNGGASWMDIGSWDVHVDHHAMCFDETNGRIYLGNDGGLYLSSNNGSSWTHINNLPFTQFYAIDIDYNNPQRIIGGTQDNNTIITYDGAVDNWDRILGGDGMYCLIDYSNPNTMYAEYQWGNLHKSTNGGDNFDYIAWSWSDDRVNWSAPLAMDPENPQVLYFGTYRVWKSTNGGNSWNDVSGDITKGVDQYFHTIATIHVSPVNNNIVVAGTGDGLIHVSENAGLSWTNITNGIPDRWVTRVLCDPVDENTIYATVSGFRWDEYIPHVLKSTDLGQSWTDISSNLPGIPVADIVVDPDHPGYLYVATDAGVFFSNNDGISWESLNEGIHGVPTMTLKIHNPTRTLVAGTHGLSAFRLNMDDLVTGTAIAENNQPQYKVYPNPFTDKIKVAGSLNNIEAALYTLDGKRIAAVNSNGEIDTRNLPKGTYILKVQREGKIIQTEKLVKN
ncbi:MAG TPA: T9SS type A sorting domain-containing protein [Bacteroidales bacterium]|nr:T9SS type A sorting domain-containing protein [Bacteroidales bacterium]